jgi:hypothetical protein
VGKSHLAARITKDLEDQLIAGEDGAFKPSCASYFCEFEVGTSPSDGIQLKGTGSDTAKADSESDESSSDTDSDYDGVSSNSGGSGSEHSNEDPILKLPVAELLKTLAWDLTEKERTYESHLIQRQSSMKTSTIQELWEGLFDNGYFTRRPCFLVIDGLDTLTEEERGLFYSCIKGLSLSNDATQLNLKIVLVGRSNMTEELVASLGESFPSIAVTEQENEKDIRQFIKESLKGVSKFSKVLKNAELADHYMDRILEASRGNFECELMISWC